MNSLRSLSIATALIVLCVTNAAFAQWTLVAPRQIPAVPGGYGGKIAFLDGVLVAGSSRVALSLDLGDTWRDITPSAMIPQEMVRALELLDRDNMVISTDQQKIFKTTNGGTSWTAISPPGGLVEYVDFIDNNPEWLISIGASSFTSTDAGRSWGSAVPLLGFTPFLQCRRSSETCYVLSGTSTGSYIFRSTNLGRTWQRGIGRIDFDSFSFTTDECDTTAIFAVNEEFAAPTDGYSAVYSSSNMGTSWSPLAMHRGEWYCGSIVRADKVLYVQTQASGIERSTDNGVTWQSIGGPVNSRDTRTLCAVTANLVFASDVEGNIFRTFNSGGDSLALSTAFSSDELILTNDRPFAGDTIGYCESLDRTFTIDYAGCKIAKVLSGEILGDAPADYSLLNTTPEQLNGRTQFTIRFSPRDSLLREARLVLRLNDNTTRTIVLNGYAHGKLPITLATSESITLDTIGDLELPIAVQGLLAPEAVGLIIRYDPAYLEYRGSRSLAGRPLDLGPVQSTGVAKILINSDELIPNAVSAYARFRAFGERENIFTTVTLDSISFASADAECVYRTVRAGTELDLPDGCGTAVISNFMRGNRVSDFRTYPNPTTGVVSIDARFELKQALVSVMDTHGITRLVRELDLGPNKRCELDLSQLSSGIYFLKIDGTPMPLPVVKEK